MKVTGQGEGEGQKKSGKGANPRGFLNMDMPYKTNESTAQIVGGETHGLGNSISISSSSALRSTQLACHSDYITWHSARCFATTNEKLAM